MVCVWFHNDRFHFNLVHYQFETNHQNELKSPFINERFHCKKNIAVQLYVLADSVF